MGIEPGTCRFHVDDSATSLTSHLSSLHPQVKQPTNQQNNMFTLYPVTCRKLILNSMSQSAEDNMHNAHTSQSSGSYSLF